MKETKKKERVLTPAEQERKQKTDVLLAEYAKKGYSAKPLLLNMTAVNLLGVVIGAAIGISVVMKLRPDLEAGTAGSGILAAAIVLLLSIVSTPLHEFLHGCGWAISTGNGFASIRYGFNKKAFVPYCTCGVPLKKGRYLLGTLLPCVVLGVLPLVVSAFVRNYWVLLFGLLGVSGAVGDLCTTVQLLCYRRKKDELLCIDHPTEAGLYVIEK